MDKAQSAGLVVPVKAFSQAKQRLSPQLSASERADLARLMASHVVSVAAPFEVFVVCDDTEVKEWARGLGVGVVMCPGVGLNRAVAQGVEHLRQHGFARAIIAHGDLPFASEFTRFAGEGEAEGISKEAVAYIAPDRWESGTNVLSIPAGTDFAFSYGPGSFSRHVEEAQRLGLKVEICRDADLGWDIDLPRDLKPEVFETLAV